MSVSSKVNKANKVEILLPYIRTSKMVYIAVDGSYSNNVVKYGFMLTESGDKPIKVVYEFVGKTKLIQGFNIRGEIAAVIMGLRKAISLGYTSCILIHDYNGIAEWVNGNWEAKQELTIKYREEFKELNSLISIRLQWIKGHGKKDKDFVRCNNYIDNLIRKTQNI